VRQLCECCHELGHAVIGGPIVVLPYFRSGAAYTSGDGIPPGGAAADS